MPSDGRTATTDGQSSRAAPFAAESVLQALLNVERQGEGAAKGSRPRSVPRRCCRAWVSAEFPLAMRLDEAVDPGHDAHPSNGWQVPPRGASKPGLGSLTGVSGVAQADAPSDAQAFDRPTLPQVFRPAQAGRASPPASPIDGSHLLPSADW
jgi:hypothetical protein